MALYEEFEPRPNRLINAKSGYLRAAAYQPIGWFEYGPEAFAQARQQDKPILLDIGAVWCHWCHVIDRESYEDTEVATLINELFIPVKVDRDERPDIDARYQAAVQALAGQGGWPLTVFLDPDGRPFYGTTYLPPRGRGEVLGMMELLPKLADAYRTRRGELEEAASQVTENTYRVGERAAAVAQVTNDTYRQLAHAIASRFDARNGGFERSGPKFPHPGAIEVALLQWYLTHEERWLTIAGRTLFAMGQGGIYDHLGGGFHRYAVDPTWTVPHFEKMSSDNAQLLEAYVHAYAATGIGFYRDIAEGTLCFLLGELADHAHGGFYASQDADINLHDDGDYWTWTLQEFTQAVGTDDAPIMARYFGVRLRGDMPESGRNVLRITQSAEDIARDLQIPADDVQARIIRGKLNLYEARRKRNTPHIDQSKYASWNALCVSACLEAGSYLERDDATRFALRTADALIADAYDPDHGVYHMFHSAEGARLPGFLDDQVYTAMALLKCFEVSGKRDYLDTAHHLLDICIDQYWDAAGGGFRDLAADRLAEAESPFLGHARKVIEDLPTPAANAVAAQTLDRLWLVTGDDRYHEIAGKTLETFADHAPDYGPFAAHYGLAVFYHLHAPATVFIIGRPGSDSAKALRHAALHTYRPGRLVASLPAGPDTPYPATSDGSPLAYVCAAGTCAEPTADPEQLVKTLTTLARPRPAAHNE